MSNYYLELTRVINIDNSVKISLSEQKYPDRVIKDVKKGLQLLDPAYYKEDLNLYYDLAALNPIEDEKGLNKA